MSEQKRRKRGEPTLAELRRLPPKPFHAEAFDLLLHENPLFQVLPWKPDGREWDYEAGEWVEMLAYRRRPRETEPPRDGQ